MVLSFPWICTLANLYATSTIYRMLHSLCLDYMKSTLICCTLVPSCCDHKQTFETTKTKLDCSFRVKLHPSVPINWKRRLIPQSTSLIYKWVYPRAFALPRITSTSDQFHNWVNLNDSPFASRHLSRPGTQLVPAPLSVAWSCLLSTEDLRVIETTSDEPSGSVVQRAILPSKSSTTQPIRMPVKTITFKSHLSAPWKEMDALIRWSRKCYFWYDGTAILADQRSDCSTHR